MHRYAKYKCDTTILVYPKMIKKKCSQENVGMHIVLDNRIT